MLAMKKICSITPTSVLLVVAMTPPMLFYPSILSLGRGPTRVEKPCPSNFGHSASFREACGNNRIGWFWKQVWLLDDLRWSSCTFQANPSGIYSKQILQVYIFQANPSGRFIYWYFRFLNPHSQYLGWGRRASAGVPQSFRKFPEMKWTFPLDMQFVYFLKAMAPKL